MQAKHQRRRAPKHRRLFSPGMLQNGGIRVLLSCIVVILVTGALTLPGISASKQDLENAGVALSSSVAAEQEEGSQEDAPDAASTDKSAGEKTAGKADSDPEPSSTPTKDAANAEDADAAAETPAADADAMPAQSFSGELKDKKDEVILSVEVESPEGSLPAGTTMELEAVKAKDVKDAVGDAVAEKTDAKVDSLQAVDITFKDADGNEVEPAADVAVKMASPQIAEETNPYVVNVDDKGEGSVVDQLTDEQLEQRDQKLEENELAFDAAESSVYAIAYTVDFRWAVDGKTYEFSIPGGGFTSLGQMAQALGLANDAAGEVDANAEAAGNVAGDGETAGNEPTAEAPIDDEAKAFVADVKSVEFSDPSLVWVGKADADTTVASLKEANELDVQYSSELTKEQIEAVESKSVEAGDWALISLQPFMSAEKLTVTMNDGEVFTIEVTDAQISAQYLSDNGELFEVTVAYGDDAQIPEGAQLKVTELDEYSQEFQDAWKAVTGEDYFTNADAEEPAKESTNDGAQTTDAVKACPAGMAALDIAINDSEGQEVEPKAPVSVSITMKSLPENLDKDELRETVEVHHINETADGKVAETVAASDGNAGQTTVLDDSIRAEFDTDGFSTYTITWGNATNSETNLRFRENNANLAQVTVHYVDQGGNPISRPDGINANTDQTVSWSNNRYTYSVTEDNLARTISGYSYQGAHSGSYDGAEISTVTLQRNSSWWGGYSYSTDVNSIYLVYSGSSSGITVHYGYMDGGNFVEFNEDEDGDVPAGTTVPKPSRCGDQWDLEKTIPGYRYVTSRLNNPNNGREISSLLNTDPPYVQNTNNAFENASQAAYPNYTSSVAPQNFNSEWRYRQLSSIDWNPTGDHWNYSSTEPVTGSGVTKPVSFAETDKDIYVIYEKGSMSGGDGEGNPPDLGELNAPVTDKQVESNHDGTYDVTLSVKGEKKDAESSTKANVVVVLDTSWSMYEKDAGNGQSRLAVAKSAIGSLADKLFALNSEEADTVELAFVTFAQRVRNEEQMRTIYSGTDSTAFKQMINGLDCASGTNWDDALYAANHIYFNDNDPTYIVFVTDGDPISCAHPYGTYSDWDGGTYYDKDKIIRNDHDYALAAKNQADLIIANNKTLYTIGAFGTVSNLQAIGGTYLGQANDTDTINGYFDDIISEIQSALGYQDITINDGITVLSSTGLARRDISSLRYFRSGGTGADGTEKYDHTANNGHGVKWEDAPAAYLLEVKSENGQTKYYKNGTEVGLDDLTTLSEDKYLEKYPVGTRTVIWDINAGSEGLLEDGVTYTMMFTMWPSQEAYDLIADLNNQVITYDSLSQAEKDQVFLGDDGVYYLKTNTEATVDYTSVRLVNGEQSGDPVSASALIEDPKGKMNLDTNQMTVKKEFAHLINEADPYEEIVFYLLVDGKYYNKDGSLSYTLDKDKVYAINLPKDGEWEDSIYIAPGLMRGGEILETGHNYSLVEEIVSGNPYEYEFAPQTVRPMVITAVPTFLVEKDAFNTNTENKKEYTFNDADGTYVEVDGKSDDAGTYYAASENSGSLVGVNHKTSELDITKIINANNLLTPAQEAAETFTYRVTLQVPDGADPSGIVGYEYVPRTQENAFTLFGYQTGQSAFADDIARFKGKTYRAWNTLVYDALIEYERVTENGRTYIVAKRDENGNIKWKVPEDPQGYHTITYDMTLKQDEVIRFTNLPTGTKYTIQEIYANKYPADNVGGKTDGRVPVEDASNLTAEGYEVEQVQHTGGDLSADKTTVTGTIEKPDSRYYNQFTNKKTKKDSTVRAELKVKKNVEGYAWGNEYYRFTLKAGTATYTDTTGGSGTSPMPDGTADSSVSVYNTTAVHTLSFGKIRYTRPGTYTYTVSEYDNSSNMPHVLFATPVTLTVTVAANNDGTLSVQNIVDDKGTTVFTAASSDALAASTTTQTNTTKKIQIKKVDKNTPNKVLSDAVFEIYSGPEKQYLQGGTLLNAAAVKEIIGMDVSADGAEAAMKAKGIQSSFTLGQVEVSGFTYNNAVYELREVSAPAGYVFAEGSVYFKVVLDGTDTYLRLTDESGVVLTGEDNEPILDNDQATVDANSLSISIKNEPGKPLPNTGGPGTAPLYVLGALMVACAVAFLLRRRTA